MPYWLSQQCHHRRSNTLYRRMAQLIRLKLRPWFLMQETRESPIWECVTLPRRIWKMWWKCTWVLQHKIDQNRIGDKGGKWISQAGWVYLKSIFLSGCDIGGAGALHLSKVDWKDFRIFYLSISIIISGQLYYVCRIVQLQKGALERTENFKYS